MNGTTLLVSLIGSILVLSLRYAYALAVYIGVLIWYPHFLRVSIGTIDISAGRIVVFVLLLRCIFDRQLRDKFVWSRFDKLVALSMAFYMAIYCLTRPFAQALENRGGYLVDTWFTYLVVRLILTDKQTVISFIKTTAVIMVPLAILALIESVTHWQPFYQMRQFRPWRTYEVATVSQRRWGLTRALGPFSHYILFGGFFAMFLPLIWSLRHQRDYWGKLSYVLCGMAIIGAFFSMSSGPWTMLLVVIFCLAIEKYKRWVKVLLVAMILLSTSASIACNRPLYHVLYSWANFAGGDYWQRVKLIDAAIENFDEWCIAGYGGKDPGWHGTYFWGHFTDMNNEFISAGVQYGILGIIVLFAVFTMAFKELIRADRRTKDIQLKSLYWGVGSALVGLIVLAQGVSFFGQMPALFYSVLGVAGSSSQFVERTRIEAHLRFKKN